MENSYTFFESYLNGTCPDAYKYFGCHKITLDGKTGFLFRVYAPMAKEIDLIGDFNSWDPLQGKMRQVDYRGLYELFVVGAHAGQNYKYHIYGCDGFWKDKQDPFAFADQEREMGCSIIADISSIHIDDHDFVTERTRNFDKPMSIYEFHFGSWKRKADGSEFNYSEIADVMIPYLREMGYTHVEFLPVTAYPNDMSWGYQALGYYAIDQRWGDMNDFASFVEKMHKAGIGIIMDFVPVHFAIDPFGLEKFDGSCVFEYGNDHEFTEWGTKSFDLGKDPVRSFLMSSVLYFAKIFNIDGFRFDAVSNIIYWDGNSQKGENSGAIEFIKRTNKYVHDLCPDVMMIAEDSSAYGHVTKGLYQDGLGFDYKWDLGWMNDTLKYYSKDPVYKKYCHNQITFSMAYFYSENFVLPLSHDEVVHMKGSIVNKMWGSYDNKFANVRNLYAYQFAHPGKKLNFMGNELATFDEWKEWQPIAFNVLDYPKHKGVNNLIRDLNHIYRSHSALYNEEYNPTHFSWIMADNSSQSVYVFYRESQEECIVCVFNMTPNFYWDYDIGVPYEGSYEEILNTDKDIYGGWNQFNGNPITTNGAGIHNQNAKLTLKIPSFGAVYLCYKKNHVDKETRPFVTKDPNKYQNKTI
ncbi:MAG: 1,4-alpha-glucan branching protein GlgB [Bacilli bacterium]